MSDAKYFRHESTKRVFLEAVESGLAGTELDDWLSEQCGSDAALRLDVEDLLRASVAEHRLCDLVDQTYAGKNDGLNLISGQWVGPYQIEALVGEGGMGVVYRARQTQPIDRTVAIKMVKPGMDSREILRRFQWEQAVLARLEHPNIARLLDAGTTENGQPYFVMEFVNGQPLIEYCNQNRLTIQERFKLFETVCSAIRFAHQHGVLHRDLKPGNVLVADGTGTPVAKIIDFGIAKLLDADGERMTHFIRILGTQPYSSPEQQVGDKSRIDTRSDVFSLGILLHELVVGRLPDVDHFFRFSEPTLIDSHPVTRPSKWFLALDDPTCARLAHERQTSVSTLHQFLAGDLDWILLKAMAKSPSERYESVESFSNDLSRLSAGLPVQARRQTKLYLVTRFFLRHKAASLLTSAALSFLLLGFGISLHQVGVTREAHRLSERLREGMIAAQQQTLALVEAADWRLAANAIDDGDYLEAADILDRQIPVDLAMKNASSPTLPLPYNFLHTQLERAGRSRLETHLSLYAMAFDPEHKISAVGGEGGIVHVIDLRGNTVRSLPASGQPSISSLAFSQVTGVCFAGGSDGSIKAFSLADEGGWQTVCNLSAQPIVDFCISRDARHLFVCDGGADVSAVEIKSGKVVRHLRQHEGPIYGIAISEDGTRIATTSKDQTSAVWQWPTGNLLNQTSRSDYRLVDVALDSAGKTLVDGSVDGEVRLVDVETGKSGITIRVPSAVSSVDISADGKTVVAGCRTGMIYCLTREDFERSAKDNQFASTVVRQSQHQSHDARVEACLCLAPDSVFSVGRDGRLVESSFRSNTVKTTDVRSKNDRIAVSPNGDWIAAHDYIRAELIETATGKTFSLDAELPKSEFAGLNFSPQGDLLLTTQDGRIVKMNLPVPDRGGRVNVTKGSIAAAVRVFDAPITADYAEVRFSRSGDRMMLFSRRDSLVIVVSFPQLELLFKKEVREAYTADLSASGRFLATSRRGDLFVNEVDGGRLLAASPEHHTETINDLRFSPDERWLYTASNDRRIKRWNYQEGTAPELVGVQPSDMPKFLSISRDGNTLLSSGRGQQIWLWHTGAMQKLFPVMPSPDGYYRTYLSADDSTLIGLDRQFQVKWTNLRLKN
ncbi:WD40 repeat domain-containing serine/threonine-protein kinase [Stieleria sp. ICT_E10.1]|uniref:WD40 repeat domain-containing serine/threonine-protein kinase n=1 Tax=Stieleria sedimenti TaxID=2976331 RepID=UPI00217F2486|nr:WD40 repeat domain-containing serine/threonine-protein kinase [Stieleria sedimenti]MCS7466895.1 WD40 repeat domain-containing serine/threonine-protein kinase [Stieleria sedimenti]